MELLEESKRMLRKMFEEDSRGIFKTTKEQTLRKIKNCNENIQGHLNYVATYKREIMNHKIILKGLEDFTDEKLIDECFGILENSKTSDLHFQDGDIVISTVMLYFTVDDEMFELGKMKIRIPYISANDIIIENLTQQVYGYSIDMHHPHVFENGGACLGNSIEMVNELLQKEEYYALYCLLLNFLQTANPEDEAGAYYRAWRQVDPETKKVICEGTRALGICEACGESVEDIYICSECGKTFCEDHIEEINGEYVCRECRDDYYTYCEECGEYYKNEEVSWLENYGMHVCNNCLDNNYIECDECENCIHENDIYEYDGIQVCKDCYDKLVEREENESDVEE